MENNESLQPVVLLNQKRLIDNFLKLAAIKSYSKEEKAVSHAIMAELSSSGMDSDIEASIDTIGNLHAFLPGNTEAFEPILFCCHMDTVKPGERIVPVMHDGMIMSDGTSILGADDKAGIAAVLELLHVLNENHIAHGDIEIVFTVMEEAGMLGAKSLDFNTIRPRVGYVVDGSMKPGFLATAAPYKNSMRIVIRGAAAHAGVSPEKGVSSIQVAAKAIADMKLLRIDECTTANIGTISGGVSDNIVCPEVTISAEVRSLYPERLEKQISHMRECILNAAAAYGAEADIRVSKQYPGYSIPMEDFIVQCFKYACARAGLEFGTCISGGGTDANIFNMSGIKSAVVGTGVKNAHTPKESISVNDLVSTAALLIELAGAVKRRPAEA
ncbi:MAG: M20/M25/M40 family metallo-hydrolase [Clostridiaceae bacterium]